MTYGELLELLATRDGSIGVTVVRIEIDHGFSLIEARI